MHGEPVMSKEHIGSIHSESITPSDSSVFLMNEALGLRVQIVDRGGNICAFPGVESCPELENEISLERLQPRVRYSTTFQKRENGHHRMLWTVRPDGRYWMDSWGFGAEDYEDVTLYADIDETGKFIAPFRLYSIGYDKFA